MVHAKKCYKDYPTIVNMIPKETNKYENTSKDFAIIDNKLSASQTDIGESSNLAQLAQSYDYSFKGEENDYADDVCILSVLAQVAIDNSKRTFDINLGQEIKDIKTRLNVRENKYPKFWKTIKPKFNAKNINKNLSCPMNSLCDIEFSKYRPSKSTLPMSAFIIKYSPGDKKKQCKKVEQLIEEYSFKLKEVSMLNKESDYNDWLLVRSDFEKLISDIQQTYISGNYRDLMSWLLDRAFAFSKYAQSKSIKTQTKLNKNKVALISVLYEVNPKAFLECFVEKHE